MNRRTLTLTTLAALLGPQQLLAQTNACPALLNHRFPRLQDGAPQDLCQFSGKVLLIVNTASYCGFTGRVLGPVQATCPERHGWHAHLTRCADFENPYPTRQQREEAAA